MLALKASTVGLGLAIRPVGLELGGKLLHVDIIVFGKKLYLNV